MAPAQSQDKSLSPDQVKLLTEVMTQAKVALTPTQWNDIALNLGISNGKAAKERFRYMMNSLSSVPSRSSKTDDNTSQPATPKSTAKKTRALKTPASGKGKTAKESAKKRKLADVEEEEEGEGGAANGKDDDDANEVEEAKSAIKTPKAKKVKKLGTPFRTPKKVEKQESNDGVGSVDGDGEGDGDAADSDTTKVEASNYSGTTQAETPKSEPGQDVSDAKVLDHDHDHDNGKALGFFGRPNLEEEFGAIGGDGSMFPEDDDVI